MTTLPCCIFFIPIKTADCTLFPLLMRLWLRLSPLWLRLSPWVMLSSNPEIKVLYSELAKNGELVKQELTVIDSLGCNNANVSQGTGEVGRAC